MHSKTKYILFRLILIAAPLVVAATAAELVLRRAAAQERAKNQKALAEMYADRPPMQEAVATLPELIRRSPNPRRIYELIPNLSVQFMGARVTTDANGFRNPAPPPEKPPGSYRIVGLGDSSMFGWGVNDEETYLAVLAASLSEALPNTTVETLNTGIPGYNTVMELATLTDKALAYQPDFVLIHYVGNDRRLPRFLSLESEARSWTGSHLLHWLQTRQLRRADTDRDLFMRGADEVPEEFAYMATDAAYHQAMQELKQLSKEHGFDILIACNLWPDDHVTAAAREVGVPLIAFGDAILPYMKANGIKELQGSTLSISKDDPHYSALGHTLIADQLAEVLLDRIQQSKR